MENKVGKFAAGRGASVWAILVAVLLALGACSSSSGDGDGSSTADGSCGVNTAPALTSRPAVTPDSGTIGIDNGFEATITVEPAEAIDSVLAWLVDYNYNPDSGEGNYLSLAAVGELTRESEGSDTWSGSLEDTPDNDIIPVEPGPHYLWVYLYNEEVSLFTTYWRYDSESETNYYCVQYDSTDSNNVQAEVGVTDIEVVYVTMEDAP